MSKILTDHIDELKEHVAKLQHELQNKEQLLKFQSSEIERLTSFCKENWDQWQKCVHDFANYKTLKENGK